MDIPLGKAYDGGDSPARRGLEFCQAVTFGFSGFASGGADHRPDVRKPTGNFAARRRVPPLAKPFGVDLDRPLEVAGRVRDDEGARDHRFDLRPDLTEQ